VTSGSPALRQSWSQAVLVIASVVASLTIGRRSLRSFLERDAATMPRGPWDSQAEVDSRELQDEQLDVAEGRAAP
jgi:hypothetical protein